MEFRLAQLFDVDVLAQMEQKFIECGYSQKVLTDTINDEQSKIFLLTQGSVIVGYGGYKIILDTAEIYNIVVDLPFRRNGYAKQILQYLVQQARLDGAQQMFLEVNQQNLAAINLYTLFDFKQISIRKNYYKSGNAIIMKKFL